ncbi:MAG TPA: efflux RND transporter periplasmic adaptor subunit [Bacteroidales bacterium]|nr:efflux RND transporter periplasmic adaptor subunit [Bacteroidales bacterium]
MNKPFLLLALLLFGMILTCCQETEKKEILINHINHTNFEDILTIDGTVDAVRSVTLSCPQQLEGEIVYLIEDGTHVEPGDLVCQLENRETQDVIDQLEIEVENSKAVMAKVRANLDMRYAQLDAQVKTNAVQTSIANLDSLQLIYASPVQRRVKELELQKAAIIRNKLTKKLRALDIINKNQIRRMELQIQNRENRLASMMDMIDMMTIKASQSGMVVRAISWQTGNKVQEGDHVYANMPIINIPDMTEMKVKIQASEASYKRININDLVEYTFDAMPGNTASGKILSKAPVGRPISRKSKVKFFEVEASMESWKELPTPGLSVSCNIILQRVKDTIVVPQIAIFEEDSMKMVYVKHSGGFEKRQIEIGPSSPKLAVISRGLTGKESLSLNKPSSAKIKKTTLLPKPVQKTKPSINVLAKKPAQNQKNKSN